MLHPLIDAALQHSPKHRSAFCSALAGVARGDIAQAAAICGDVCRREGVADFPNPFRGTAREDDWARAFAGEAVKTAPEPLAQAAPISFAAMTKAEIVGQVRAQRGVDLNPSLTKAELIAAAEKAWSAPG